MSVFDLNRLTVIKCKANGNFNTIKADKVHNLLGTDEWSPPHSTPGKIILGRRPTGCGGKEKYFVPARNQTSVIKPVARHFTSSHNKLEALLFYYYYLSFCIYIL